MILGLLAVVVFAWLVWRVSQEDGEDSREYLNSLHKRKDGKWH
jgi:hypothetical protein